MRSLAALVVIASLAVGCHPPDPARRMRQSQFVIAGGLLGVGASSIVLIADPPERSVMYPFLVGFGAVAIAGLLTYIGAASADARGPVTQQQIDDEAWQLTKRAREAARKGDCGRVKKIAPAVKDKDVSFYDVVFMRDAAIQRCFAGAR